MRPTISPILIDTNIPVYAAGRAHPLKEPALAVLDLAARNRSVFFTDAEVLQELLHRYLALRLWEQFRGPFHAFARLMEGRVEPISGQDVLQAAGLADQLKLAARDLIHLVVMNRVGTGRIASADSGFDRVYGIERLDPMQVDEWRDTVTA